MNGYIGAPYACPNFADKSIQVVGDAKAFAGSTLIIEGSNMTDEPLSYSTLNDATGAAISLTSAAIKQILENTVWVRPRITGAGGAVNLDVYLLVQTTR